MEIENLDADVFDDAELIETEDAPKSVEPMNDAEILGEDHPELEAFLEKPMVFMTGDMYGQGDRRNTRPGKWKRAKMPLINWMLGGKLKDGTEWGLTRHPEDPEKGGASIVPSDNFDGERTAEATHTMYAIVIDVDTGAQFDQTVDRILEEGRFALVSTTHSHMKDEMLIKSDHLQKALKIKATPTLEQVQEYLMHHHKDRHPKEFVDKVEIIDPKMHTKNGLFVKLKTPAVEKLRIILPLAEEVVLQDLADTFEGWKKVWADAVAGVCVNMLGVEFDTASCDVNRLFYTPRHAPGAEWESFVILGKPLRFEEIEPYSKEKYVRERKASGDPFLAGTGDVSDKKASFFTPSGKCLREWHREAKARFEITDVLETYAPDKIRDAGGERQGTVHIECPFEHEHTTPGGTACMAMNPDANKHEVWTVFCHHDSCKGRDKLEFLQEMLQQQWFPESVLFDDGYMIPLPDQDRDDYFEAQRAGPITDLSPEGIQAALADASISKASSIGDVETFMRRCFDGGANKDPMAVNRINAALMSKTDLLKGNLKPIWERFAEEAESARQRETPPEDSGSMDIKADATDQAEYTRARIKATNATEPTLFQYIETPAVVRGGRLKSLSENAMRHELRKICSFTSTEGPKDAKFTREVFPPKDLVSDTYESDLSDVLLPLSGVVKSPFFTEDGEMVTKNGYHAASQIYLDCDLDLPRVSAHPTYEEAHGAARYVVEEVWRTFHWVA